jgi:hypothetical protein
MKNSETRRAAPARDPLLAALWRHADDAEADVLRGLLVKSGQLWQCRNCAAVFGWEVAACEFCATPQPTRDCRPPFFRVEYDLSFRGGDYSGTGEFAYVPFALIAGDALSPEQAFARHTGIDAAHVVHYTLDEAFDDEGRPFDE